MSQFITIMVTYSAGNKGERVRSDCFVSLTPASDRGIIININSSVKTMYGESIEALCRDMLDFYGIRHAEIEIEDRGALPFTLAARLEAVIRKHIGTDKEYLLPMLPQNIYSTRRENDRITRLYLPGNNPKLMINAGIYESNGIILDLEDSVAPDKKYEARFLVRNALRTVDFYGSERMVRINQLPAGFDDLAYVIPHHVNLILIPKCESADQVLQVDAKISEIMDHKGDAVYLMPIIESASGVMHAFEIAGASENVVALAIGLEDYTADIGAQRTAGGKESYYARCTVVNAARAADIQPIDSVFSDIDDLDALAISARESKALGFAGMGCIHPLQVPVINESFLPTETEIEKAKKITVAFEKSEKEGIGVVALESKMIDPPVVKRALRTIEQAINAGKLSKDWRDGYGK
ncbi:MAG: citrate lyase subunit beta [Bacteroidales bacterium]|nr:citrate lyase subunit beta [Bacteroidales bacterium]